MPREQDYKEKSLRLLVDLIIEEMDRESASLAIIALVDVLGQSAAQNVVELVQNYDLVRVESADEMNQSLWVEDYINRNM